MEEACANGVRWGGVHAAMSAWPAPPPPHLDVHPRHHLHAAPLRQGDIVVAGLPVGGVAVQLLGDELVGGNLR